MPLKSRCLGILAVVSCLLVSAKCGVAANQPLNVMSFNIRFDNPADGFDNWKFRARHVAAMFKEHQVDAGGLQEVKHHQLVWLQQALPEYQFVGVGRDDGKEKGEYAPVFFRKSEFDLLKTQTIWLSEMPEVVGSKGWDAALPRIATLSVLRHKKSDTKVLLGNTHYDHRGVEARKKSAAVIHEYLAKLRKEFGTPVVLLTGDFNCLPGSAPFKAVEVANDLVDAYKLADQRVGPDSTWSGFRAVEPGRRIDYVFTRKGTSVRKHVIDDKQVNGRFPSDHLPVIVQIQWEGKN